MEGCDHFSINSCLSVHKLLNLMVDPGCAVGTAVSVIRYRFELTRAKTAAKFRN
jgi:hypothetical protein